jgi:mono/diheme cytochrome c family protein
MLHTKWMPWVAVVIAGWLVVPVMGQLPRDEIEGGLQHEPLGADPPGDDPQAVRALFSAACYACHGPDEASREAGLRLDRRQSAMGMLESGDIAIVPGDPDASELVRRVTSTDPDVRMPPPGAGDALTTQQVDLLTRWIERGAPWQRHWAFVAPRRPPLPEVSDSAWPSNPIDRFVLAALETRGLRPSAPAEREILLRRVALDLTGLPPTLAELDDFLADESPGAYERAVDRLLASPHFGEHMARYWLDAARYGDTHGLHLDNYREMWPYRDWVVQAFNRNLPYDQFVIEQLAGDLLPGATLSQRVATGFCRAHVTTNEGGSIEEEVFVRNVIDRVSTTGTVFLGLTVGCAACHDHKFDPLTQREFYELFAFFNSLDGPAMDGNVKDPAPVESVPSDEQSAAIERLHTQIHQASEARDRRQVADAEAFEAWLSERIRRAAAGQADEQLQSAEGLVVHATFEEEGDEVVNHANSARPGRIVGEVRRVAGPTGQALELGAGAYVDLGNVGDFQDDRPFSYGLWVRTSDNRNSFVVAKTDASQLHRGYQLSIRNGYVTPQLSRRQPGYTIKVVTREAPVSLGQWHHVAVTYDGSKLARGVVVYVDGRHQPVDVWSDALRFKDGIGNSRHLLIGRREPDRDFDGGQVDDVRVYEGQLTDSQVRAVFLESRLQFLGGKPRAEWTPQEQQAIQHFYLMRHDKGWLADTQRIEALRTELRTLEQQVPTTLVFRERKQPREAYVLLRGAYDQHGDRVTRATPAELPPLPADASRDRLGLAQWMVSPEHPLTSRVAVNRLWQQLFGIGLVETSEDFGNQGTPPSHPALLDWLAVEFRESGWDVKALMKQIVMSSTYRQSSAVPAELAQLDPKNRWLARGPRFRLDAETLRDQALFVSGALVTRVGGPSVKPPQPPGLWKAVGFSSSNTVEFVPDTEPERIYRRSLYTFLKRTAPPPSMSTFDAPSRESPCVRRERTNTPLQALLLLNDPQFVQSARVLAQRALDAQVGSDDERAAWLVRLCTARQPAAATVEELVRLYREQLQSYRDDPRAARELLAQPEATTQERPESDEDASRHAAWTIVANLVLNLDEVITKN